MPENPVKYHILYYKNVIKLKSWLSIIDYSAVGYDEDP